MKLVSSRWEWMGAAAFADIPGSEHLDSARNGHVADCLT